MSIFKRLFGSLFHNPADDFNVPGAEYEGRPIGAWFHDLSDPSHVVREKAEIALSTIGEPALPALSAACGEGAPRARVAAASALGRIGLPALPTMVDLMFDKETRVAVPVALVRMGPVCLPALVEQLREAGDDDTREAIAHTLADLAQSSHLLEARAAPPPTETHDPLQPKRVERIVEERTESAPPREDPAWDFSGFADPLLALLASESPTLRRGVARALWRIGARGGRPDPALVRALADEDPALHLSAAGALAELDASIPEALAVVSRSLALEPPKGEAILDEETPDDESTGLSVVKQVRLAVSVAASFHQEAARPLVAPLIGCLLNPDAEVRYRAKVTLAGLGAVAVEALARAAAETEGDLRRRVASVLGDMRQQYAALCNAESSGDAPPDGARADLVARAANLRAALPVIVRTLIALADDPMPDVSERAVRALGFVSLTRIPDEALDEYADALERHDDIAFHDLVSAILRSDAANRRKRGLPLFQKLDENGQAEVLLEILRDTVRTREFSGRARAILDDLAPAPSLLDDLAGEVVEWVEEKAPDLAENLPALRDCLE